MKFIEQDENGRLVIDLEGERIELHCAIPGNSPAFIKNGRFTLKGDDGTDINQDRLMLVI